MDKIIANQLVSAENRIQAGVIIVVVMLVVLIQVRVKRKGLRKKTLAGDLVEVIIAGKDNASSIDCLPVSFHRPSLTSRTQIAASNTILHVGDISTQQEHKKKHRVQITSFQPLVTKITEQDYFLSDLLEVSLTNVGPPDREELPSDPPLLKLPGWLRDPRLPRPPVQPSKPIKLGPGLRIKTPAVPINHSLHDIIGSSLAKTGPDFLLQSSHIASEVDNIFAHTKADREFLASEDGVQTSVSEIIERDSFSFQFLEGSSEAKVAPSGMEDNIWPASSDPTSLKLPGWLRDPRLQRPPIQPTVPRQKTD